MIDKSIAIITFVFAVFMLTQAVYSDYQLQKLYESFQKELADTQTFVAQEIHANEQVTWDMEMYLDSAFKSYMDASAITNKSSKQHKIVSVSAPDPKGFYKLHSCYLVALGSNFGSVGDVFDIKFSEGVTIRAIKAEQKRDEDTYNGEGVKCLDGSVVEFIVDIAKLPQDCRWTGDCSNAGFYGNIISITKVGWYNEETGGIYEYTH